MHNILTKKNLKVLFLRIQLTYLRIILTRKICIVTSEFKIYGRKIN